MIAEIVVKIPEMFMMLTFAFMVKCDNISLPDGQGSQIHLDNRKSGDL
jgi:hypothetical protein